MMYVRYKFITVLTII